MKIVVWGAVIVCGVYLFLALGLVLQKIFSRASYISPIEMGLLFAVKAVLFVIMLWLLFWPPPALETNAWRLTVALLGTLLIVFGQSIVYIIGLSLAFMTGSNDLP